MDRTPVRKGRLNSTTTELQLTHTYRTPPSRGRIDILLKCPWDITTDQTLGHKEILTVLRGYLLSSLLVNTVLPAGTAAPWEKS